MRRFRTASPAARVRFDRPAAPDVSVIIVTYGTGSIIGDTLAALAACADASLRALEVIVVDQPHPERGYSTSRRLMLDTVGVTVVRPEQNLGFGGGCELGVSYSAGPAIVFLNPDALVEPGSIDVLVDSLDADDGLRVTAPVLVNPDGTVQEAGGNVLADGTTSPRIDVPDAPVEVDYASAACWAVRRSTHLAVGGFDPAFFPAYFEDVDYAIRLQDLGGSVVVVPDARVVHYSGHGTPDRPEPAWAQLETLRARHPGRFSA